MRLTNFIVNEMRGKMYENIVCAIKKQNTTQPNKWILKRRDLKCNVVNVKRWIFIMLKLDAAVCRRQSSFSSIHPFTFIAKSKIHTTYILVYMLTQIPTNTHGYLCVTKVPTKFSYIPSYTYIYDYKYVCIWKCLSI